MRRAVLLRGLPESSAGLFDDLQPILQAFQSGVHDAFNPQEILVGRSMWALKSSNRILTCDHKSP
jgi:hypothetical protein